MPSKIFISTGDDADSHMYLNTIKAALFRLNDFPVTAVSVDDVAQPGIDRLAVARNLIDEAQLFIGIFLDYGTVPAGQTQSDLEAEYHYAHERGLLCLIFVPEKKYAHADARFQAFLDHLIINHIIHTFVDAADLQAQVIQNIGKFKETQRHFRKLQPPPLLFQPEPVDTDADRFIAESVSATNLDDIVKQAITIAADDIEAIVRRALELHSAHHAVKSAENGAGMTMNPIFGAPMMQSQFQSDIFMITPFRPEFDSIYQNVIRPVVSELNLTIKRGDDFASLSGSIINEIWAALNACHLVIVETTEVNANVYYELGIAHTLGKPAILLTQEKEVQKLPFDIRHLRFIVYENTIPGGEKLEADLKKAIIWIMNDLKGQPPNGNE
jgi:hypothetical protein